jgi:hypothetical protein
MNKTALLFGVGASLILAAGTASAAGSCGAEVAELQQKIGIEQGANATIGATDPGVQQPAPESDTQANATTGTTTTTDGSTTTADSSSSTATMPSSGTVEETSRVGDLNTAAGGHAEAITALKKAQMAADAGDENTCMTELGTAKAALGVE